MKTVKAYISEAIVKGKLKQYNNSKANYVEPYSSPIESKDLKDGDYIAIMWNQDSHGKYEYLGEKYNKRAYGIVKKIVPVKSDPDYERVVCYVSVNAVGVVDYYNVRQEPYLTQRYIPRAISIPTIAIDTGNVLAPVTKTEKEYLDKLLQDHE